MSSLLIFGQALASLETREQRELRMAEKSVLASIAVFMSPKGHDLCSKEPLACVGSDKAELGLALIGARKSPESLNSLIGLLRLKMDGALAEDYECYVLKYGALSKAALKQANVEKLREHCRSEVTQLINNEGLDAGLVCSDEQSIRRHVANLIAAIDAGRKCADDQF
jgi:hypothetical protein